MAGFYVVWKGRKPGIYGSWPECEAQTKKFSGAKFKSFATYDEALAAFQVVEPVVAEFVPNSVEEFVPNSAVVDASSFDNGKVNSRVEWRGFVRSGESLEVLFAHDLIPGTNNIGEFLALIEGLKSFDGLVYSDSELALTWLQKGEANSRFDAPPETQRLIDQAVEWLNAHPEAKTRAKLWVTKSWGENPADYGRKS